MLILKGKKLLLLNEHCTFKNETSLSMNRADFGCRRSLGYTDSLIPCSLASYFIYNHHKQVVYFGSYD